MITAPEVSIQFLPKMQLRSVDLLNKSQKSTSKVTETVHKTVIKTDANSRLKDRTSRSPESNTCQPYSIPNEFNHSSSSPSKAAEPWLHPGWVHAPWEPHTRVSSTSDGWLLGDKKRWQNWSLSPFVFGVYTLSGNNTLKVYMCTYGLWPCLRPQTRIAVSVEQFPMGKEVWKRG